MSNARVQAAAEGMSLTKKTISPLERMQDMAGAWMNATPQARAQALAASQVSRVEEINPVMEPIACQSLSERVNDLFARYVAAEEEQWRLGDAGHDREADALSEPARLLSREIHDIRDRTGNADLIVSRLLLELMLTNQWPKVVPGYEWLDWDQHTMLLPIIEALVDRTTGVVRFHAAKALATIGVEVPTPEADPLLSLIAEYRTQLALFNATPDDMTNEESDALADATFNPPWYRLRDNCPMPTTMDSAIEAVRLVRHELQGGYGGIEHSVLAVVVAYFDGTASTVAHRTIGELIEAHKAAVLCQQASETAVSTSWATVEEDLRLAPIGYATSIGPMRHGDEGERGSDAWGKLTPRVFQEARRVRLAEPCAPSPGGVRLVPTWQITGANDAYQADIEAFENALAEADARPAFLAHIEAERAADAAMAAESAAWNALAAAPCQTHEETQAKIGYFTSLPNWEREFRANRDGATDLATFLRSLTVSNAKTNTTPFAAAYATFKAEGEAYDASESDDPCQPIYDRFFDRVGDPPRMTTPSDAATALRHVIDSDAIGDSFDEKLIHGALAFLES